MSNNNENKRNACKSNARSIVLCARVFVCAWWEMMLQLACVGHVHKWVFNTLACKRSIYFSFIFHYYDVMVHEKQMQNDTENGRSRRSTEYINNNEFYCALENHFFAYKTHTQNINIVNMHQRCRIHTHTHSTPCQQSMFYSHRTE